MKRIANKKPKYISEDNKFLNKSSKSNKIVTGNKVIELTEVISKKVSIVKQVQFCSNIPL
jgi:predicted nucleic acid-binding protein